MCAALMEEKKERGGLRNTLLIAMGTATANYFSDTLCYPFDTMNTWIKTTYRSTSIIQLIRAKVAQEGLGVLVRGINTQFYGVFTPSLLYFSCYEFSNQLSRDALEFLKLQKYSPFIPTFTATFSEIASLLILVPMDAVKTRYQLNSSTFQYTSTIHALRDIVQKEGPLRLFKASPLFFIHMIVYNTVLFQSYELFRINQMKKEKKTNEQLTAVDSLRNTIMATIIAASVTNPFDLVLTRYQVVDSSTNRLSMAGILREVYRHDGIRGLNRGVFFKTFYRCIDSCIYLPIYEELRKRYGIDFSHMD